MHPSFKYNQFIDHKKSHTLQKIFKCDQCDKKIVHYNQFIDHKMSHILDKTFKCDQCDKEFLRYNSFINHKKSHDLEKIFHKRTHDDKMFTRNIVSKISNAEVEKPFIIDIYHIILAVNVKPFQLPIQLQ